MTQRSLATSSACTKFRRCLPSSKTCGGSPRSSEERNIAATYILGSEDLVALSVETNPIPIKAAASLLGLCSDELRLPLVPMSGENLRNLQTVMEGSAPLLPTPEEVL